MSSLRYEFKIPDESKPLGGDCPPWGPFYELVKFSPPALTSDQLEGRVVDEICTHLGTYGMGGPGFFGLRFGSEWLVFSIWGADSWIEIDGRIVQDCFWEEENMPRPWISDSGDELSEKIVGQQVKSLLINQYSLRIEIGEMSLAISKEPDRRPIHGGSKQPRAFEMSDDLRKAVFLAPTAEIWV